MLQIRKEQLDALQQTVLRGFEDEMVAHAKDFAPTISRVLGDEQLRVAIRQAMKRAETYKFTNRGPIRLYIELIFLCGSDFDTDPQYPALGEALRADDDQMERAERIHQGYLVYLEKVSGPQNVNVRRALEGLVAFAARPPAFDPRTFEAEMLGQLTRIFPQKAAYIGEPALRALIQEGRAEAAKHGFAIRGEALIVALMSAFGHGCANDPLYPWIAHTLTDERIKDSAARADRLERKAITWLDHVLARPQPGAAS